jgi:cell division protein FtsI/penicillin-binding protein 2
MNNRYFLEGIGINVPEGVDYRTYYRLGNTSWIPAESWSRNIPEVSGIDKFYWGSQIGESNDVEFKFEFSVPPDRIQLLSVAEYATSHDGKRFGRRHFFDGIQDIRFSHGEQTLLVNISDLNDFNRRISTASLQMRIDIQTKSSGNLSFLTDKTWNASIDRSRWMNVRLNPYFSDPSDGSAGIPSVWYPENWIPLFKGVKYRYFKKDFKLDSQPISAKWKVFTSGEYLVSVNSHPVENTGDFSRALRKGLNRLTIMISKKGYSKRFPPDSLFKVKNGRIVLKRKMLRRSSFVRGKGSRRATIYDARQQALAYSVKINDKFRRFYALSASRELQSLVGHPKSRSWGLEQVFHNLHRTQGVSEIHLTINSEWQKIGTRHLSTLLQDIKNRESQNPVFLTLMDQLRYSENQLGQARDELANSNNRQFNPIMMRKIIDMENRIDNIKTEINKIKNYFYEASILIMNTRGQILLAAYYPYDESGMQSLNDSLSKPYRAYEVPELNRCWKWKYNPGSTAKILDSIAFLHSVSQTDPESGDHLFPYLKQLLDPSTGYENFPRNELKGSRMLNGKQLFFQLQNFRGHNIPYGFCSLQDALTHSYNTYFAYLALHNNRMLTHDSAHYRRNSFFISKSNIPLEQTYQDYPVLEFAEKFGFNRKIDLLSNFHATVIGRFLNRSPYDVFTGIASVFPINAYTPSEIAYFSIGQSDLQLTGLQNLLVASTIMNSGFLYVPSLIKSIKLNHSHDKSQSLIEPDPEELKIRIFDPGIASRIKEAMSQVVASGTAGRVFSADMKQGRAFYAKTGTAETKFHRDHSFFVGFASFRNGKKIIFSTVVPRSGTGAAVAGRLTARIIGDIIKLENAKPDNSDNPY